MLIAIVLLAAALALGAGIGWVALDQAARRIETERQNADTERAIADDLKEADIWQGQERWAKTLQLLERARTRLAGSGLTPLKAQIEERRRDAALVVRLEVARLKASVAAAEMLTGPGYSRSVRSDFDYARAIAAYESAFMDNGLDVAAIPPEDVARYSVLAHPYSLAGSA